MSSGIWTQSAGSSEIRPLAAAPWRVVEGQHRTSTRKLVGSDREQHLLEEVIEAGKPAAPAGVDGLHYLLYTPFRYPPLARGTRFASRWEPGVWYGAETIEAALAEVAYYRLLFLEGSEADLGTVEMDLTAFRVPVATPKGIDLTVAPFDRWREALTSKTSYAATQPIGATMRDAGVEVVRYESARHAGGRNVALFTPAGFAARRPRSLQTWYSASSRAAVEVSKDDYLGRAGHRFERERFLVDGVLPDPAVACDVRSSHR